MAQKVFIRMMGAFVIEVGDKVYDDLATRSRKGAGLMQYLILQRGTPTSSQRMTRELWSGRRSENPENALKTLVSRTRSMLNGLCPELGRCIVSSAGGYSWECAPDVSVDVLEIMDIYTLLGQEPGDEVRRSLSERLLELYRGDLFQTGNLYNDATQVSWLHREYLDTVYRYVEVLKAGDEHERICEVCQAALKVDEQDEHLHILLMEAMSNLNRTQEALEEYRRVSQRSRRDMGEGPGEALLANYQNLAEESQSLQFNLDAIHSELTRQEKNWRGPYFCEYRAFKEIYNIEIRNVERLGSTMFLGVIMLVSSNPITRESAMAGLQEILRTNLRKGDIVTRFSDNMYAMLLPTVSYNTGSIVLERIERRFYQEYPANAVSFHARISPMGRARSGREIESDRAEKGE